jgi:hypothetical protein
MNAGKLHRFSVEKAGSRTLEAVRLIKDARGYKAKFILTLECYSSQLVELRHK